MVVKMSGLLVSVFLKDLFWLRLLNQKVKLIQCVHIFYRSNYLADIEVKCGTRAYLYPLMRTLELQVLITFIIC